MEKEKILENLELMKSEIEWEFTQEYAVTLDVCEEIVKNMSQREIDSILPWNRD